MTARRLIPTLAAGLVLAPAPAAALAESPPPPCTPRAHERVLERLDQVVVLRKVDRSVRATSACDARTGRRVLVSRFLHRHDLGTTLGPYAVASTTIAYGATMHEAGGHTHFLVVRNLRRPGSKRTAPASGRIREVAAHPQGRAAAASAVALRVVDEHGPRLLDTAVPGGLGDLAFAGRRLTWTHGGEPRSARVPLPSACAPTGDVVAEAQSAVAAAGHDHAAHFGPAPGAVVCTFAGGGWRAVPDFGDLQLAADLVAVRGAGKGGHEIEVRDVTTLEPARPTAFISDAAPSWALGADGTVVTQSATGLTAQPPSGPSARVTDTVLPDGVFLGIDDTARAVVFETEDDAGSFPLPGAATARVAGDPCAPRRGEQVVAEGDGAVVLSRRPTRRRQDVIGCRRSDGRRITLAQTAAYFGSATTLGPFATAGSRVAMGEVQYDRGLTLTFVRTYDLERRKPRTRSTYLGVLPANELAIDARGRVAALTSIELVVDGGDDRRRLDIAVPGSLGALAIAGAEVTWTHAGEPRRAPLGLPRSCRPPAGTFPYTQGATAVVGERRTGNRRRGFRWRPVVCRFPGGGWVPLGPPRGREALPTPLAALAEPYLGVARLTAAGTPEVQVRQLATGAPVGAPVPLATEDTGWTISAAGDVVTLGADRALHVGGGGPVLPFPEAPFSTFRLGIDEPARALVWEDEGTDVPSSSPLPTPSPGAP